MRCPGCQSGVYVPSVSTPNIDGISKQFKPLPERPARMEISATMPVGQESPGTEARPSPSKTSLPQPRWSSVPAPRSTTAGVTESAIPPPKESSGKREKARPKTRLPRKNEIPKDAEPVEATPDRRAISPPARQRPQSYQAEYDTPEFNSDNALVTRESPGPNGNPDVTVEKALLLDDAWLLFYCPTCSNLIKVDTENSETAVACNGCGQEFSMEVEPE